MKLLIFPLIFLIAFSMLSWAGIGKVELTVDNTLEGFSGAANGWFDSTDHLVMYPNGTVVDATEGGRLSFPITAGSAGPWNTIPLYTNSSGTYNVFDATGERMMPDQQTIEFDIASSLGLVALIAAGIILAAVVGTRILGSGVSEESVSAIWKGTLLLAVWSVFSVLSMSMITAATILGPFFYLFLTIIYCLGVINQVGHPGED